jgi:hypothetical protein
MIATKSSVYYLELWAKVLKRRCWGYHLIMDAAGNKVVLKRRNHSGILWFDITNAVFVRDLYICFRLCGDDVARFARHWNRVSHEQLNQNLDGTPPHIIDYAPRFD